MGRAAAHHADATDRRDSRGGRRFITRSPRTTGASDPALLVPAAARRARVDGTSSALTRRILCVFVAAVLSASILTRSVPAVPALRPSVERRKRRPGARRGANLHWLRGNRCCLEQRSGISIVTRTGSNLCASSCRWSPGRADCGGSQSGHSSDSISKRSALAGSVTNHGSLLPR